MSEFVMVKRELLERIAQWGSVTWPDVEELRAVLGQEKANPIKTSTPINYGSLDPVQRLAFCRGEQPSPVSVALPERGVINEWMKECGWQNSSLRQADLPNVERFLKLAFDKIKELNQ